ncbi:hypothetical protein GDO86_013615 [Hymenochirus boettgeri]|uniref:Uncharacterized protein n=1 Tax=Hymenochirus boettgeri TaxID=247094 RepID=A0A8T2IVL5_9PIPI|nr:hypothetical protein GDO86_013615 [Hymenochirus boettgeri]
MWAAMEQCGLAPTSLVLPCQHGSPGRSLFRSSYNITGCLATAGLTVCRTIIRNIVIRMIVSLLLCGMTITLCV